MTTVVISQPMYFPWAGFMAQMRLADVFVWLDDAQFSKGSFTNRVQVHLPGKQVWMTVPLRDKTGRAIRDLAAKDDGWRASHRDLLVQSLRRTTFRDSAMACFDAAMSEERIVDVLIASAKACAAKLSALPRQIVRSSDLAIEGSGWPRVLDIVRHLSGTRYVTGHGARQYLDHEAFEAQGIAVEYMDYQVRPWPQHDTTFTPYVTALDLIARIGPEAASHLIPRTMPWRDFIERKAENT